MHGLARDGARWPSGARPSRPQPDGQVGGFHPAALKLLRVLRCYRRMNVLGISQRSNGFFSAANSRSGAR